MKVLIIARSDLRRIIQWNKNSCAIEFKKNGRWCMFAVKSSKVSDLIQENPKIIITKYFNIFFGQLVIGFYTLMICYLLCDYITRVPWQKLIATNFCDAHCALIMKAHLFVVLISGLILLAWPLAFNFTSRYFANEFKNFAFFKIPWIPMAALFLLVNFEILTSDVAMESTRLWLRGELNQTTAAQIAKKYNLKSPSVKRKVANKKAE